jgi:hypothetical protein
MQMINLYGEEVVITYNLHPAVGVAIAGMLTILLHASGYVASITGFVEHNLELLLNFTPSFRYASGNGSSTSDLRSQFIRLNGWLQRKEVEFIDSDPRAVSKVLSASNTKGSLIEMLIANPAWAPIYSIESVDGALWEQLARDCRRVMSEINYKERLSTLVQTYGERLLQEVSMDSSAKVDAEKTSRFALRVLYDLVFESSISPVDEDLFFNASMEWRKELGVKGLGDRQIKEAFWKRLGEIVAASRFQYGLETYREDPGKWISVFAQPFLISPQINVSDIMVAVFGFLRKDRDILSKAQLWAKEGYMEGLNAIIMESIRLQHPFPLLERDLERDVTLGDRIIRAGTQVVLLMDNFRQDQKFNPDRWLDSKTAHEYGPIPFGSGKRMCIGKPIATALLCEMLQIYLRDFHLDQVQPAQGHKYSGRNNDNEESLAETWYQLKVFARVLYKSYLMGRQGKCPFLHGQA